MTRAFIPSLVVAAFALAVGTAVSPALHAQDRPDQQKDQSAPDQRAAPHVKDHPGTAEERRGGAPDDAATLRQAHPHSSARCHDGFFTTTRDRSRACSKHGGIDVWLQI